MSASHVSLQWPSYTLTKMSGAWTQTDWYSSTPSEPCHSWLGISHLDYDIFMVLIWMSQSNGRPVQVSACDQNDLLSPLVWIYKSCKQVAQSLFLAWQMHALLHSELFKLVALKMIYEIPRAKVKSHHWVIFVLLFMKPIQYSIQRASVSSWWRAGTPTVINESFLSGKQKTCHVSTW